MVGAAKVVVAAKVAVTVIDGILMSSEELLARRVEDEEAQKDEGTQEVSVGLNGNVDVGDMSLGRRMKDEVAQAVGVGPNGKVDVDGMYVLVIHTLEHPQPDEKI